jgi:hypothetical protein
MAPLAVVARAILNLPGSAQWLPEGECHDTPGMGRKLRWSGNVCGVPPVPPVRRVRRAHWGDGRQRGGRTCELRTALRARPWQVIARTERDCSRPAGVR